MSCKNCNKEKEIEIKVSKKETKKYFFPTYGITIEAISMEEAEKILLERKKQEK